MAENTNAKKDQTPWLNIFSLWKYIPELAYLSLYLIFLNSCHESSLENNYIKLDGKTQGTTFHINFFDDNALTYEKQIDSLLKAIDQSMSTYIDSSILSEFNASDTGCMIDEHILRVFLKSYEIYEKSHGAFDPTVKPLIDFWGFGTSKIQVMDKIDKSALTPILQHVGLGKIRLFDNTKGAPISFTGEINFMNGEYYLLKEHRAMQLDFNAIAQGYTVDVISNFLESKGIENYLVEIGGELRGKGLNAKGELWKVGIDKPTDESTLDRPLQAILTLKNASVATSGNYRKFFIKDGIKYSHTIDPATGYPVQQKPALLSVTVLTSDCMGADGYATAIMAMGLEKGKELLQGNRELEAYIIYDDNGEQKTFLTEKMKEIIELKE